MNVISSISGIIVMASAFAATVLGQDITVEKNLLKEWRCLDPNTTVIQNDGIIACENKTVKEVGGVVQSVSINQNSAKPVLVACENKAEGVSGDIEGANYAIYLDVTYTDDTRAWGVRAAFKTGTHDWEKASLTYTPDKPVKTITYYILLRNKTGKAWFRNALLAEIQN